MMRDGENLVARMLVLILLFRIVTPHRNIATVLPHRCLVREERDVIVPTHTNHFVKSIERW